LGQASIAKSSRAFPNFGSAAAKQALGLINPNTYVYIYPSSELYIAFLTDSEHQFGQAASRACPAYIIYRYVYIYIYMYIYIPSIHLASYIYVLYTKAYRLGAPVGARFNGRGQPCLPQLWLGGVEAGVCLHRVDRTRAPLWAGAPFARNGITHASGAVKQTVGWKVG